jgi:hypothetical protein
MPRLARIQATHEGAEGEKAMSSQMYDAFQGPAQSQAPWPGSTLRGIIAGFIPLVLLLIVAAVTVLLTALARQLFASSGFFAQQQVSLIVLVVGLCLALMVYIVALVRTLRKITSWRRSSLITQARAALIALGITALVVLLPVILALVLPQNPAP